MHRQTHRAGPTRLLCLLASWEGRTEEGERNRVELENVRSVR